MKTLTPEFVKANTSDMKTKFFKLPKPLLCLYFVILSFVPGYSQITILKPNGGEAWISNSIQDVRWTQGVTSGTVRLEYSVNGGMDWIEIVSDLPDAGTYAWTIPDGTYTSCRVRISDMDGDPNDESDSDYIILPDALPGEYIADINTMGLWHMNEPAGMPFYDFSGHDNQGHYDNNPEIAAGIYGNCRILDEIADNVIVDDISGLEFGNQSFTVEAWIKCEYTNPNNGIISTNGYGLQQNSDGTISFRVTGENDINYVVTGTSAMNDGAWHHVAGVRNGDEISIFIDGLPENTVALENQFELVSGGIFDLLPWADETSYDYYIDEIRISNKARSPEEFNVPPNIRLTSPKGSESWMAGSEHVISWNSVGISGNVMIEFSENNGGDWTTIVSNTPDMGSYAWTISGEPSTQCLIRVSDTDGSPSDVSDQVFTVLDQNRPVASNPQVYFRHYGDEDGNEEYHLHLLVNVTDPQGLDDIQSVTVTSPDNQVFELNKDMQQSGIYQNIWFFQLAPPLGDYTFTVTDILGNKGTITKSLSQILDFPRNIVPANNEFVTTATPTFSWNVVDGTTGYHISVTDMNGTEIWWQDIPTDANSIGYNQNETGQPLTIGMTYRWQINAGGMDGASTWHNQATFVYSTDTETPVATNARLVSMHRGDDNGNEGWGLEAYVNVADPQGLTNIASVTVTFPNRGATYNLYDNGQFDRAANDGYYGYHIWDITSAPPLGDYIFTITDADGNIATTSASLQVIADFVRNVQPVNNSIVTTQTPVFSWTALDGISSYTVVVHNGTADIWRLDNVTGTTAQYDGPPFEEGKVYYYRIHVDLEGGRSWHDDVRFVYSSNTDNPVAYNPRVVSMHRGDDSGNEGWGLEAYINVSDPQGLTDIASVTVSFPNGGSTYNLYDNGQFDGTPNDGHYGYHVWDITGAPPFGEYLFTITDKSGNIIHSTDNLEMIIDYPRNATPSNNALVTSAAPVFSWSAVDGISTYSVVVHNETADIWSIGNIAGTSVEYTGPALEDGKTYYYRIHADLEGARSWNDDVRFTYSSDPGKPILSGASVQYRHWGREGQYERYGLHLRVNANDPQGLGDIASVEVTCPSGTKFTLYDDGQHADGPSSDGYYGLDAWELTEPPMSGTYYFVITDAESHRDTAVYILNNTLDIPRNVAPVQNGLVTPASLTFTWDPVPGAVYYNLYVNDENGLVWRHENDPANAVTYNDDGTGQSLAENRAYNLTVNAINNDATSWHDANNFQYLNDSNKPKASNPIVQYIHYGYEGYERYGLRMQTNVNDPQGLGNILSATATSPTGLVYTLYDDGQHWDNNPGDGIYGNDIQELIDSPVSGNYYFVITDAESNQDTVIYTLNSTLDIPRNLVPVNGGFLTSANLTFSWDPVPGAISYGVFVNDENGSIWSRENISGNSITYNDNSTGQSLTETGRYRYFVQAFYNQGNSTHWDVNFTYSADPFNPIATNPSVQYRHWGREGQYERYGLHLRLNANDPQGLGDIASVEVTCPSGTKFTLYDDGQHSDGPSSDGYYGLDAWDLTEPPMSGNYYFVITDAESHRDTAVYILNNTMDIPRNVRPVQNGLMTPASITFSWDPVPGATHYNLYVSDNNGTIWSRENIQTNSITYNDDGTGQTFAENGIYNFTVYAINNDATTWHDGNSFTYTKETDKPIAANPSMQYIHHGTEDYERFGLHFQINATDPQGLANINSVAVEAPTGIVYTLFDDGQHGDNSGGDGMYANDFSELIDPPAAGNYYFIITDAESNKDTALITLENTLGIPQNLLPTYNSLVTPENMTFSWDPVPGAVSYSIYFWDDFGGIWSRENINGTSITYNDDGTGATLSGNKNYRYSVTAVSNYARSWHYDVGFIYRTFNGRRITVDQTNQTGNEDGSPEHPFNTIQKGINAAITGDSVLVKPGTYFENLQIQNKSIVLISDFGDSGNPDFITNTIIDGNHAGSVITGPNLAVIGFTIQNGQAGEYGGGGILTDGGDSLKIHNCIIQNNSGVGRDSWGAGGVTSSASQTEIHNCIFRYNYSPEGCAAIRGGVGTFDIVNTLVYNNTGSIAFHFNGATGNIINSTVVNNPGGSFGFNNSPLNLINCIEWNNGNYYWGQPGSVDYSCMQVSINGTGTIHTNPVFMDSYNGDFTLQLNSPCIDAGNPDAQYNDKNGSANDMGYYGGPEGESYSYLNGPPVLNYVTLNRTSVYAGQALLLSASVFDAQSEVNTVIIEIEDPDENVIEALTLYDDGTHGDNLAGDGIFRNAVTQDWVNGHHYFVDVTASDDANNSVTVNNAAGFDGIKLPETMNIPYTHETMRIDGNAGETIWNSIPATPVTRLIFGPLDGPEDLSASYKACWNLDSLFVLIDITDDSLDNIHGANYWENDKISLYLDMDNSHSTYYDANDWDMTYVWEGGFFPNRGFTGTRYAHLTNAQQNGYQLEIALSLKDLGYPMGDKIGLDLDIMDRDGTDPSNTLLLWNSDVNENYFNPGRNGIGNLMDYSENMPDQALKITGLSDFPICGTSSAEIKAFVYNFGSSPVDQFDISYSLNGDTLDQAETAHITINPGDTVIYTFAARADLTASGIYALNVFTLLNNGDPHANFNLATDHVIFGIDSKPGWTIYSTCNGLPGWGARYIMDDSQGNIWVGTSQSGAERLDTTTGNWTVFNSGNSGFTNNNAITLFEDHEGKIWVGLDGSDGVAMTWDGTSWTSNNSSNNHVLTMFEDHDNNMWFGTWGEDGVRKWDRTTGMWTSYNNQNSGLTSHDMWYGAIMEDKQNNMWFGTISGGLYKYDGFNWTNFNNSNSGLPTNLIVASLMDRNGNIWMGHGWDNQGVTRYDGSNWTRYTISNSGLCNNTVMCIFEDHSGNLWFGTNNGVSRFDGTNWITYNTGNSGLLDNNIASITEDANGDIWIATSNSVCKFDIPDRSIKAIDLVDFPECGSTAVPVTVRLVNTGRKTISQFDLNCSVNNAPLSTETVMLTIGPGDTASYTFNAMADLSVMGNYTISVTPLLAGGALANQSMTTQRFVFGTQAYKEWKNYNTCNGLLPGNNITYIKEDSKKNLWVSIGGAGLARFNSTSRTWMLFDTTNSGLSNLYPTAICEDNLGNIWVGSDQDDGIVTMFDGTNWTSNNPENVHVLSVMEDHAGNMWFGTWDHGVREWNRATNTWTTYTIENSGMPTNITWFDGVMEDPQHNMWFACIDFSNQKALAKFDGTTWTQYTSSNSTLPSNNLWGALMDSKGRMWLSLGWGQGVAIFDGSNTVVYNNANTGTGLNSVVRINEDKEGNIWFSCGNGAIKFDGTTWTQYNMSNSGMAGNGANCIAGDHSGNIWIGGNGLSELIAPVEPITLYTTEIPAKLMTGTYDLGTEFRALKDGYVTKARLYTNVNETGNHDVRLWQRNGTSYTLLAGPYSWNITSGIQGWREFTLPTPVALDSGAVYIITITTGTDRNLVYTTNIVMASSNDGIQYIRSAYSAVLGGTPSKSSTSSYFRDVVFIPEGLTTNVAPVITAPASMNVFINNTISFDNSSISLTDSDNDDQVVTINATRGTFTLSGISGLSFITGDGTTDGTMIFSGTLAAINSAMNSAYFTPSSVGPGSLIIKTHDGKNGIATQTVSINVMQDRYTLYTTEIPAKLMTGTYDLGTEFRALKDGYVTKARLYTNVNETGNHDVRLWQRNGTSYTLLAGPYSWNITSGIQGWREFTLPTPVALDSGAVYIITITTGTDRNLVYTTNIVMASSNDGIQYIRSAYSAVLGGTPSKSSTSSYFRDVVFIPGDFPQLKTTDEIMNPSSMDTFGFDAILYPNPVENFAFIKFVGEVEGDVLIQIHSMNGSLLYNSKAQIISNKVEINIQELKHGIYFIRIILNDHIKVLQMIKN
jgi:ligand-binding sensor domain-containing protein